MGKFRYAGRRVSRQQYSGRASLRPRPLLAVLMGLSLALVLLSRLGSPYISAARARAATLMTPVLSKVVVPIEAVKSVYRQVAIILSRPAELERLRAENRKLRSWEWRAREAERKTSELEALARVVEQAPLEFVTGRVVASSSAAFVRSVLINAGLVQGVRTGYPAISGDGLVGRITEVGSSSASVMLLTDAGSRVPVVIGPNRVRAILTGNNGRRPVIEFLPPDALIAAGEEVSTSGVGGMFPAGLRIGTVSGSARRWLVDVKARLDDLEYVSVVFFETPILDLVTSTPTAGTPRRTAPGDQARSTPGSAPGIGAEQEAMPR